MALWDDIQPCLDAATGLLLAPDGGRDNMILLSAYLYRELVRREELGGADALHCDMLKFLYRCQVMPGLYKRQPDDHSDNSPDNIIAYCYISPSIAVTILMRWGSKWGCFDVNRPDWVGLGINWYGRFIGLKSYIKAAVSVSRVSLWDRFIWSVACLWSTYTSKGASNPLLQSLQNDVMPGCTFAKRRWNNKYNVKSLLAEYFGPNHPIVIGGQK